MQILVIILSISHSLYRDSWIRIVTQLQAPDILKMQGFMVGTLRGNLLPGLLTFQLKPCQAVKSLISLAALGIYLYTFIFIIIYHYLIYRLYKKSVIQKIMPEIQSKGYAFQMEIVMRAQEYKFTIQEVPIIFVDRIYGESKLGTNEIVIYLKGVWKLFWTF